MRCIVPPIMVVGGALRHQTHPHIVASFFLALAVGIAVLGCWLIYAGWPTPADRVKQGMEAHVFTIFGSFMLDCGLYGTYLGWKLVVLEWPATSVGSLAG
jgi:hypothetical protein